MSEIDAVRQLELCQARAEVLHNALSGVVGLIAEVGGFMSGPHQILLARAIDALGVKPRTKTWPARNGT